MATLSVEAIILKFSGMAVMVSPWLIHTCECSRTFLNSGFSLVESGKVRTSVFTCAGRFYFSTVRIRHELCTIADTQNRILSANVTQIDFKGAFIIKQRRGFPKG